MLSSAQRVPTGRFIDTMKENGLIEFRWHGRGGQGAKTACLLLADAAFCSGKYVQGFPEYGPERMGAPITAYNRISDVRCTRPLQHLMSPIMSWSWTRRCWTCRGRDRTACSPEGAIVINSAHSPRRAAAPCSRAMQGRVCTIDARKISEEDAGQKLPQHPHAGRHRQGQRRAGGGNVHRRTWRLASSTNSPRKPQVIEGNMSRPDPVHGRRCR